MEGSHTRSPWAGSWSTCHEVIVPSRSESLAFGPQEPPRTNCPKSSRIGNEPPKAPPKLHVGAEGSSTATGGAFTRRDTVAVSPPSGSFVTVYEKLSRPV